ncbi:MAG: 30S ribosomal protein S7 [Brevinemataceae bacterium]
MPRKKAKGHFRPLLPDGKYNSVLVTKLVNRIMLDGKKSVATAIVYNAMEFLAEKSQQPALEALEVAINNIKPPIEVRSRRVGGATYQVPVDVRPERQLALALRWLADFSRKRREHSMEEKLGKELFDAFNNGGSTIKKRVDTLKMAEANRAFAHYKW